MSDTNSPEQETPETRTITPEESGAAVVPETEETANDAETTAAGLLTSSADEPLTLIPQNVA